MQEAEMIKAAGWMLAASGAWFLAKHWREARRWSAGWGRPKRGPIVQLGAGLFQALALAYGLGIALGGWSVSNAGATLLVSVILGMSGGRLPKLPEKK